MFKRNCRILTFVFAVEFAANFASCTNNFDGRKEIETQNTSNAQILRNGSTPTTKGWATIDTSEFSFQVPSSFRSKDVRGQDTEVWQFQGDGIDLSVEFGRLATSVFFRDERCPGGVQKEEVVDGRKLLWTECNFGTQSDSEYHVMAAQFDRDPETEKQLIVEARGSHINEETIVEIFRSVRFKKPST